MKILHTGDWHILSSQYGKKSRAEAVYSACRQACYKAQKLKVDAIVNPGDILDSSAIRSYPLRKLDEIHELLLELGLPMYTLTGNHDMDNPTWISRYNDPSGNGIVSVDNKIVELPDGSRIVGFMVHSPKELFAALKVGEWRETDIALWHGGVAEFTGGAFGRYPTAQEIWDASPIKNWLLADIHVCQYIAPETGGIMGFSGPVEMTDINEDPFKYVCTMEFDKGVYVPASLKKVKLDTTPVLSIPLTTDQELDAARVLLKKTIGTPRMIWFHFEDSFQSAMNDLYSLTTAEDVIRTKNVTVRKVQEVIESSGDIQVDISVITHEETDGLPEDLRGVVKDIVSKAGSPAVLMEKLINKYEDTFV